MSLFRIQMESLNLNTGPLSESLQSTIELGGVNACSLQDSEQIVLRISYNILPSMNFLIWVYSPSRCSELILVVHTHMVEL
jgi:hypothetical protein